MSLRKHLPFFTSTWSLSFDSSVLSNQNSGSLLGAKLDAVSPEMGAAAAGSVAPRRTQFTFVIVIVEPSCLSAPVDGQCTRVRMLPCRVSISNNRTGLAALSW